jgi:shikimate kinase
MACLIILRGPTGSGKSAVGKYLRRKLVESVELDLDLNANGEVVLLNEVLGKENVVAELNDGGSHTTDPTWISKFKEKGYNILSVILNNTFETCAFRVLVIRKDNVSNDKVKSDYDKFHEILKPIFKVNAGILEISVDSDDIDVM